MPSLSEAFRGHPVYLHHKHPDFNSLQKLPDSYAWTTQPDNHIHPNSTVPVIDFNHPNAPNLVRHACRTWGVFQLISHGVPISLFARMHKATLALFSLPLHQKLKAARSPDAVSGYGRARISSFFPKLMWSECFTIIDSPLQLFLHLWPQHYAIYCDIVMEYQAAMEKLAAKLMCLVLASLGISKEDIKWAGPRGEFDGACAALHLNSYPSCPDPDRAMGLAAHTDSTLLTILHQNNVNGLQVLKEGEGWVAVPPLPGGLVINVGDLLHILSNGLYPSVVHRVRVNRTRQRFSVAYLYGPPTNVEISPHVKLVGPTRPALYRSVTWNEYLGTKAKHFNKALSSVRLSEPINSSFDVNEDESNDLEVVQLDSP
ncbi:gibberellin 3-beta-dioxygenase 1 [Cajanus cajan]|uniref:gibberellin 3beta-dioxygenase n=1 Tax=Cajanus cajan TaxID=3821 RepID=A0A151SGS3_CAJCA|nr:gibberellin 3-beta-dioxygenase 1 [Cajanus cajan]KYP53993.1 Gibberellin 3-beta-dioxygenase 1 [Cajanus cajan]